MAKLVLKTNLINVNFVVEQKTIEVQNNVVTTPDPIDILISPINSYAIDAFDFNVGGLPSLIKSIIFNNKGNNVIATVSFNSFKINQAFQSVYLPISGQAFLNTNKFTITETLPKQSNVFILEKNIIPGVLKSTSDSQTVKEYSLQGAPGTYGPILIKEFSVPDGFYFSEEPSYSLSTANRKNYTVSSEVTRDNNRVIKKRITVNYSFPYRRFSTILNDSISFSYRAVEIKESHTNLIQTGEKLNKKIYSIDTGVNPGPGGGTKQITVRGVPGTPFKILVQDSNNAAYNFEDGIFGNGSGMLEGIIPNAVPGLAYGEFRKVVTVPPSATPIIVKTNLITEDEIDHEALAKESDSSIHTPKAKGSITNVSYEATIKTNGGIYVKMHDGGGGILFDRPWLFKEEPDAGLMREYGTDDLIRIVDGYNIQNLKFSSSIGEALLDNPFKNREGFEIKRLSFLLTTDADNKYIIINRQPKFNQSADFVRWDSAYDGELTKSFDSSGTEILTDWGNIRANPDETLDFGEHRLDIRTSVVPTEDAFERETGVSGTPLAYSQLAIYINLQGVAGSSNITPELNLHNFLSIHTF